MIFKLNNGVVIKIDKRDSHLLEGKAWTTNRFGYVLRSRYAGRQYYFGTYKTLDEAKNVYDREAQRLHGEYANLNGGIS